VSLLLKSELRLRMGPQRCEAGIWRAGLKARRVGSAQADGQDEHPVEQVLNALLSQGHDLPSIASVLVEDELLYYATSPAVGRWGRSDEWARAYFAEAVTDTPLLIETSLAPGGRTWIAAALDAGWVERLRDALGAHDIELRHVHCALFGDLDRVRSEFGSADGMVVLLRSEGVTLVGIQDGCIADISWERCDMAQSAALASRVKGYRMRFAHHIGQPQSSADLAVFLVPADEGQLAWLSPLAQANGWQTAPPVPGARA
jgi:hypothetical protein